MGAVGSSGARSRRLKAAIVAGILTMGAIGLPMASAQAGSNLCGSSLACIYIDPAWVGLLGTKSGGSGLSNVSSGADNKTSSWENKTGSNGAWYTLANGTGSCFAMPKGSEVSSIPFPNYDKLTSWKVNGGC
ncbi:peptidase inhibitor family I36 protein [Miniimonas arenae]|uniref:peptidase inhibitor family I36 protein n=1 Tax=Miniimonas arenae TaxID=676201 RepID=UPI0028B0787D|nr:peptidase inhibitor family I36 protein [Miniimonas arenae]